MFFILSSLFYNIIRFFYSFAKGPRLQQCSPWTQCFIQTKYQENIFACCRRCYSYSVSPSGTTGWYQNYGTALPGFMLGNVSSGMPRCIIMHLCRSQIGLLPNAICETWSAEEVHLPQSMDGWRSAIIAVMRRCYRI